jgi:hypothetical protein
MNGQAAQLIAYGRYTRCCRRQYWGLRSVRSFLLRRSRSPAATMSSASSEREPGAPDVAATAAVAPPTCGTPNAVTGDDGRPMTPRAAVPPSAESTPSQSLNASIDRSKLEQQRLKTTKKQIVKELRNAERKRKRRSERARQLTDKGFLSVMPVRKEKKKEPTAGGGPEEADSNTDLACQSTALAPEPRAVNHAQQRSPSRACLQHDWTRGLLQYCRPGLLSRRLAVLAGVL